MPSPTDDETALPALAHASSFAAFGRSHLSPHDAPPPARRRPSLGAAAAAAESPRMRRAGRSSRRRKRAWKKLMWVKQSYPDNYTDQATFLENLQRNPRLKPYDFWPLVADSTVILQHVCSVIIFVVCFVAIFQERVSPVSVVSWSSLGTFVGWLLWERWVSEEEDQEDELNAAAAAAAGPGRSSSVRRRGRAASMRRPPPLPGAARLDGGLTASPSVGEAPAPAALAAAVASSSSPPPPPPPPSPRLAPRPGPEHEALEPEDNRTHQRLGTIKSALLIYCTLLGLSPILKSLTKSTSSDSIWAMSFWLLAVNIFFFDYSGGVGAKFPASLSTNAALMASTVLASRLPSTKHVFSLTLFSIQVFGLFPVFRRHVRHRSWRYHVLLSVLLALGAGLVVGMALTEAGGAPWKRGVVGMLAAVVLAALATGGCSWWLIGLQKYKNEIRGPWDPARPIIMSRTRWDDR